MSSNPVPSRTPEAPAETTPGTDSPRPTWNREKKNTRFVIKVGGIIPI